MTFLQVSLTFVTVGRCAGQLGLSKKASLSGQNMPFPIRRRQKGLHLSDKTQESVQALVVVCAYRAIAST